MTEPLIYRDGRHYDRLYAMDGPDVDFYLAIARAIPGPILELACGTGKYVIPWASAGQRVVGLDLSRTMLAHAATKAQAAGVTPTLQMADMRDFRLDERFGLIVIAGNSLCHLHTSGDLERCLACVREHLRPDGRFVIDVFVPDVQLLARDPHVRYPYGEYDDPDDGVRVRITHSPNYDAAAQLNRITLYQRRDGDEREATGELTLKMWFPFELAAALGYNGFVIEKRLGDYSGATCTSRSSRQILICQSQASQ